MKGFEMDKKALEFASKKHDGQVFNDGSGRPYIEHCKGVYNEVFLHIPDNYPKREIIAASALLHDTIEDTDTTYEEIKEIFGKEIADNVLALSKNPDLPKAEQLEDSLKRIVATSKEAMLVKMADRIFNIDELHPLWGYKKLVNYLKDSKRILQVLGDANKSLANKLEKYIKKYEMDLETKKQEGGFMRYFKLNGILYCYDSVSEMTLVYKDGWEVSPINYIELERQSQLIEVSREDVEKTIDADPSELIEFYSQLLK